MNQKEISLESFISSCDDMLIAQESGGKTYEEMTKKDKIIAFLTLGAIATYTVGSIASEIRKKRKAKKNPQPVATQKFAPEKQKVVINDEEYQEWIEKTKPDMSKRDRVGSMIQNDLYNYLKKLSTSPEMKEYKEQIQDCFHLSKSDYSDYGVQISEMQDGIDWDGIYAYEKEQGKKIEYNDLPKKFKDNGWYYIMLDKGPDYIKEKYKYEFKFYKFAVDTGDGDEANIYID